MLKVTLFEDGVEVAGHAGSAPKGEDLVCAGVSALVLSLATMVHWRWESGQLPHQPELVIKEGFGYIRCPSMTDRLPGMLELVHWGLRVLQLRYPEYVQVSDGEPAAASREAL